MVEEIIKKGPSYCKVWVNPSLKRTGTSQVLIFKFQLKYPVVSFHLCGQEKSRSLPVDWSISWSPRHWLANTFTSSHLYTLSASNPNTWSAWQCLLKTKLWWGPLGSFQFLLTTICTVTSQPKLTLAPRIVHTSTTPGSFSPAAEETILKDTFTSITFTSNMLPTPLLCPRGQDRTFYLPSIESWAAETIPVSWKHLSILGTSIRWHSAIWWKGFPFPHQPSTVPKVWNRYLPGMILSQLPYALSSSDHWVYQLSIAAYGISPKFINSLSEGQKARNSLAGWFCLRIFHEVELKLSTGNWVSEGLTRAGGSPFKHPSTSPTMWLLQEDSISCCVDLFLGFLWHGFPQRKRCKR